MDVRGRAILMPGKKMVLELEPQANAGQQPDTPPEPEVVIRQIADGTFHHRPSDPDANLQHPAWLSTRGWCQWWVDW